MFGKIEIPDNENTAKYEAVDWDALNESYSIMMYLTNPSGTESIEKEGRYLILK